MLKILALSVMALLSLSASAAIAAEPRGTDIHTHLSRDAGPGSPWHADSLLRALDEAGIRSAVVLSLGYAHEGEVSTKARLENEYVSGLAVFSGGRLRGFCGVPILAAWAEAEIDYCAKVLRLGGLKLHPQNAGLDLRQPHVFERLRSILAKAEEHGLVVLIDSVWEDSQVTLQVFREMAFRHPNLKLVFGHALFGHFRDLFTLAKLYETYPELPRNLFVDVSATVPFFIDHPERDLLAWHLRKFGLDWVLFGSDYPILTPAKTLAALKELGFTDAEVERILVHTPAKLMGSGE